MNELENSAQLYKDLHSNQLALQESSNRHSAHKILGLLGEYFKLHSVLDVGCGLGTWLSVCQELGISDIQGVDGPWLQDTLLQVPADRVKKVDLGKPLDFQRRFDLVISLEVAEHISADCADIFIQSLTRHAHVVLFSAAIPYQGGHGHINEQWLDYWIALFAKQGFIPLDFIRGKIWNNPSILWWLRQNIIVFVHASVLDEHPELKTPASLLKPFSIVHPDVYMARIQDAHNRLAQCEEIIDSFKRKLNI